MKLLVKTFELKTGREISVRVLNYAQHDARVWLQKHIAWAGNNGHGVQVFNETDEKLAA